MSRSKPVADFDVVTGPPWAFNPRARPVGPPDVLQRPTERAPIVGQKPPPRRDPDPIRG
jgi:hypothetical protein